MANTFVFIQYVWLEA